MSAEREQSAIVLGLDGVPWDLVDRWTEAGELPTFARLREEGAAGELESTTPASTPLAWPSIATGTWPDKHGLYWFRKLQSDYTHQVNTSHDLARPTLWEMLDTAVVGNVPMTYPAPELDGAMVTGMMTASRDDDFTHPPGLADEIAEHIPEYEIGLDWAEYDGDEAAFLADFSGLFEARVDLMERLMAQYDPRLFFFVYTAPDRLQHLIWDEDVLLDHYRQLDAVLATVLEYAEERSRNLFVVSDHGFGPVSTIISGNRILEDAGYLTRKANTGTRGVLGGVGITKESVKSWFDTIGVDQDRLVDSLPQAFVDMAALQIPGNRALYDVDYDETVAFFHGEGCLYVNDAERFESGVVDPGEVEQVKREVRSVLEDVVAPETDSAVIDVHDGAELYSADPDAPDLVAETVDRYELESALTDEVFHAAETKAAGHRRQGVLLCHGPDIEPGSVPDGATVVDVAPTVLHVCGEPVPEDADGRVLSELVATDARAADTPVRTRRYGDGQQGDSDDGGAREGQNGGDDRDGEGVEERLRGLGYIE